MKTSQIAILIVAAVLLVSLGISLGANASSYSVFDKAARTGKMVHIVGSWVDREKAEYIEAQDLFKFYLKDTLGRVEMVHYHEPKPVNFEQAEKVVVVGQFHQNQGYFEAEKIQMKCPSKYEETDVTAAEPKS